MRQMIIVATLATLLLGDCRANKEDLNSYTAEVKSRAPSGIEPLPEVKPFVPLTYDAADGRSPFVEPKPEAVIPVANTPKSCPHPNLDRPKHELEKYALDNLTMRGSLEIADELWALIQTPTGEMYRVRPGFYLGLHYGKVIGVSDTGIDILELVVDEEGCWHERTTQLALESQD